MVLVMAERKGVTLPIILAALLWFVMFSPWTAPHVNFWVTMALSGVVLTGLALWCSPELREQVRKLLGWRNVALGVAIAATLWGVFWIGEKVAVWMFILLRISFFNRFLISFYFWVPNRCISLLIATVFDTMIFLQFCTQIIGHLFCT